ncbi:MAG: hypothetical protein LOY00_13610 [Methylocaldum sp.]|nr:hypothetical protein [Methylocaldum sp.]
MSAANSSLRHSGGAQFHCSDWYLSRGGKHLEPVTSLLPSGDFVEQVANNEENVPCHLPGLSTMLFRVSFLERVLIRFSGKISTLSARVKISAFLVLVAFALVGVYATVTFMVERWYYGAFPEAQVTASYRRDIKISKHLFALELARTINTKHPNRKYSTVAAARLDIESAVYKVEPDHYRSIDNFIEDVKKEVSSGINLNNPDKKDVQRLADVIKHILYLRLINHTAPQYLLSQGLDEKSLDCDTLVTLYLAVGEALNLPFRAVVLKTNDAERGNIAHVMLVWRPGKGRWYIEVTNTELAVPLNEDEFRAYREKEGFTTFSELNSSDFLEDVKWTEIAKYYYNTIIYRP